MQEKADLANLNDRLACYIDKVRYLEQENQRLTREVQTSQEIVTREVSNIQSIYDHELADARKLLDETHREKAKLEIDTKRLWDENEDLRTNLAKKTKDLSLSDATVRTLETRANDATHKYQQALGDAKKAQTDARELEKERDKYRKQVEELRKRLEEESLARVDVENNNQSLREELSFKDQVFQQQLTETRSRRQVEISEIDGRLAEQYEAKMQEALQELRDQYESQMCNNRQEIEVLYETKMKALQQAAGRNSSAAAKAIEEMRSARSRIDTLTTRVNELEGTNATLGNRARDLEQTMEQERLRHAEDLAVLEHELTRLRDEMTQQLQEYQDLMDIKVSLDLEIAAYRKLLESEEARLNITPAGGAAEISSSSMRSTRGSSTSRRTPVRFAPGGKRKRTLLDESQESSLSDFSITSSSKGDIEVAEVCPEGRFVKVHNKGKHFQLLSYYFFIKMFIYVFIGQKELSLGAWQLIRRAGGAETVFKFHRSVKAEPGGTLTVWSADAGQEHDPPHSLVMKGIRWVVADNMTTVVINSNGEEVATSERVRRQVSSSASRHREFGYLGEDLHHQLGDPQGDEKCRIM